MKQFKKLLSQKYVSLLLYFILFFISRVFFINTSGVFFDSKEYFNLLSNPNYLIAITNGHFPPHEGYIILFWPLFQLVTYFHGNATMAIILGQIVLSFITLYCFYQFIKDITDKRTAIYAAIITSLNPLFWIINVTLMMENAYAAFFFISLLLLIKYLKNNKKTLLLHLSLLFLSLAILTQTMVVLWAPIYLYVVLLKKKQLFLKIVVFMIVYFTIFSLLNVFFISLINNMKAQTTFFYLYFSKAGEFPILHFDIRSLEIALRNFFIPLLRNNSILLLILSILSLIVLIKKNKQLFIFGILWFLPALYTNQWWDSLLNGRHALLTEFGIAFLVAYLVKTKYFMFVLVAIYLLICSLPTLNLLRYPIPYLEEAQYVSTLPKNTLFIESHFARPQVQDTIRSQVIYLNEPGSTSEKVKKEVDTYLNKKKPIFISSAALSEPYGLYSGPYLHNITLSYVYPFALKAVFSKYTFVLHKTINAKDNLIIYQITSNKNGHYPQIKHLQNSYRRIGFTDPLSWFIRLSETTFFRQ